MEQAQQWMRECLALARRGLGWTSPNPPVGALIVRGGEVLGRGWHAELGALHAETAALADATARHGAEALRGAQCYVSLEPCSHIGRQPSCCRALAEAGIAGVHYGCEDADPRTAGRAVDVLASLGVACRGGVLEAECRAFLEHYLHEKRARQPFAHLKLALSLDAKLACANGASQWLSGPQSHGLAHYLRQKYDAVLVGSGTVRADNPRLTVRPETLEAYCPSSELRLRQPVRVVLDPRFELLPRLLDPAGGLAAALPAQPRREGLPWLVIAGLSRHRPAAPEAPDGVEVLVLPATSAGRLDLHALKAALHSLGIRSLLIEGGAGVAQEYLAQRAVERLTLVYTPLIIGAEGLGFAPPLGAQSLEAALHLDEVAAEVLGRDVAVSARPLWREA